MVTTGLVEVAVSAAVPGAAAPPSTVRRAQPGDPGRARQEHRLPQRQRPGHRQPEMGLQQPEGVGGLAR